MVEDYRQKIMELNALKEVYETLSKTKEYGSTPDNAAIRVFNFITKTQKSEYFLPVRGLFNLATRFPSVEAIDGAIEQYSKVCKEWQDIREQLIKQ